MTGGWRRALFALVVAALGCSPVEPRDPPNIVLIMLDTARADHIPCYGYSRPTTPNLCGLAEEGVLFLNALAPAPWTLPSHASLFTGQTPGQHGLHWGHPRVGTRRRMGFREPGRSLARRLSEAGYTTVGVSNNPWVGRLSGLSEGFDHFIEVWEEREAFEASYRKWPAAWKTSVNVDWLSSGKAMVYAKKVFDEQAVEYPFFLFLSLVEPHMPYAPAQELVGEFGGDVGLASEMRASDGSRELDLLAGVDPGDPIALGNLYDEELLTADRTIGEVFEWLDSRGDFDDALIVVTSDHGEHLGEEGRYSHQLSMEKELLRIPLVIRFPVGEGGQRVVKQTVSLMDLYPTLLAAAGIPPIEGSEDDPLPLAVDLARRESGEHPTVLSELHFSTRYLEGLRRRNPGFDVERHRVLRYSWFVDGVEHRFEDSRAVDAGKQGSERVARLHDAYARALRERVAGRGGRDPNEHVDEDPGQGRAEAADGDQNADRMIEELKALGYLDAEEVE